MKTITYDETQWQLVPKVLTPEMGERGADEVIAPISTAFHKAKAVWIAMLAAAPSPPLNTQDGVDEKVKLKDMHGLNTNQNDVAYLSRSNLSKNTEKKG